jgi:mRNA interferase MazF
MGVVAATRVRRGDVFLVDLDPRRGTEIQKTGPCVVVSPDELNEHLRTVIIAPLTSVAHPFPFRVRCRFQNKDGQIVTDQIRAVDIQRLVRPLGRLPAPMLSRLLDVLQEMFAT